MRRITRVFFGLIALALVGVVGVFALSGADAGPASDLAKGAKAATANAAIDASGVKDKAQSALRQRTNEIAAASGLTEAQVDSAIDKLDLSSWKAVPLPADAQESGTIDGSAIGVQGTLTTYTDPGYLSVEAYGQKITLAVPASAQSSLSSLLAAR